jgi:hypothetical protein
VGSWRSCQPSPWQASSSTLHSSTSLCISSCRYPCTHLRSHRRRVEMSRVVELGRAVLASSTQNLELWLTTLITISPSQHSINLQLLSSGDVWIGRGHGMCIELDLSLRGDQLPHQQFHDLINSILEAPVSASINL